MLGFSFLNYFIVIEINSRHSEASLPYMILPSNTRNAFK